MQEIELYEKIGSLEGDLNEATLHPLIVKLVSAIREAEEAVMKAQCIAMKIDLKPATKRSGQANVPNETAPRPPAAPKAPTTTGSTTARATNSGSVTAPTTATNPGSVTTTSSATGRANVANETAPPPLLLQKLLLTLGTLQLKQEAPQSPAPRQGRPPTRKHNQHH